ncbi:DUF2007 domain-containing protein [Hymenobacter taeanensis]|uniref:DUF2007 domain-containing protein n=1 Tax=Hymenobacter taeanensis TaxID=2735321 RepID=A0A6M6BEZ2_9BACT|nr:MULTISPECIES: DUF2007 domain-containing protein [Hymenobacter]QJX46570.1 DUF2007 domain-containing protein [Hymenobacter taeanensis]UOQ80430.1 DUF2007 domain-containing protein [Hymenobacter sp. 5414T-23]
MTSAFNAGSAVVLLTTFADSFAAHLAKSQLDAEGIPCFLGNEHRPYGPVSGGVRLYVREQDVAAAHELLQPQHSPMHALPDQPNSLEEQASPLCPRCHHHDVVCRHTPQPSDSLFTKLRLWLLAPEAPQCHCFNCGHEFELTGE